MLDQETENTLNACYRAFFQRAEDERRWNLWSDVPWEAVNAQASDALTQAVLAAYEEELFLPDLAMTALNALRSSRGRAWFVTRWSYEEGKHALALREWLLRSGKRTDDALQILGDDLLAAFEWGSYDDPLALMTHALERENEEIARYQALQKRAQDENDRALAVVCAQLVTDEEAHGAFFQEALAIIGQKYPDAVAAAARRVASAAR